jgi:imidazole glycerol-phosphate synthase subunit HisH
VIALLDYGAGNLTSVRKALSALDAQVETPTRPDQLDRAAGIIVPGVGHFAATGALDRGWRDAILARVRSGVPLLGICLGMQWLFEGSAEAPDECGLALIKGRCAKLEGPVKVPHVGWNSLDPQKPSRLLAGVEAGAQVYFTHSYAAPVTPECAAITTHAASFAAAVECDRVFGVQFHPEKSSGAGLRILRNFLDVVETHHRVS